MRRIYDPERGCSGACVSDQEASAAQGAGVSRGRGLKPRPPAPLHRLVSRL